MRFMDWIHGARPKTLPLAVAPVITGAAVASVSGAPYDTRFLAVMLLCMGVALFLQIAANFANDYSDGIRGTDEHRDAAGAAGHAADEQAAVRAPARLVASGVNPRHVLFAAGTNAVAACACGLAVCALTGYWWFIVVGVASLLAAWCYVGEATRTGTTIWARSSYLCSSGWWPHAARCSHCLAGLRRVA